MKRNLLSASELSSARKRVAIPSPVECVILIGVPGAGKTTFYRERCAATHVHISKDLWPNAGKRDAWQQKLIGEMLAAGSSVVVDNTNPSVAERAVLIQLARNLRARVVGYFF